MENFFLEYLRQHPGTVEMSRLLYDTIVHANRDKAISTIRDALCAYWARVLELRNQSNRHHPQQGG